MIFKSPKPDNMQVEKPCNVRTSSTGVIVLLALPIWLFSCTSTEDTSNTTRTRQSRVEYMNRTGTDAAPLEKVPNMDEKASEINRKRNIEEFDHNGAANRPPEMRTRDLDDGNTIVDDVISDTLRRLPPP